MRNSKRKQEKRCESNRKRQATKLANNSHQKQPLEATYIAKATNNNLSRAQKEAQRHREIASGRKRSQATGKPSDRY